jgi:hypothetical protein
MSLLKIVNDRIKAAMKDRDAARLSALRLIKTDVAKAALDAGKDDLTDEEAQAVLRRMVKQRREAAEQYRLGGREELAAKEEAEIAIVEGFLPAALTDAQIDAVIERVLAEAGATDPSAAGRAIGQVMAALKATGGGFDGKAVNERIRARLAK